MRKIRILITQNSLSAVTGGELVVLELATYLKEAGHHVVVFTWNCGGLLKKIIEANGISLITPYNETYEDNFKLSDFDVIWVFNQVLPTSIIQDLEKERSRVPKFIFTHLSTLDTSFLDLPYVYDLENRLSSLSLFRAEDAIERYGDKYYASDIPRLATYNNPSPVSFCSLSRIYRPLKKILVVASHPAANIDIITAELEDRGYVVDTMSKLSKSPRIITPEILKRYDLVVASEKTTQYCLCSGTPIYLIDSYGTLGYLNKSNYEKAKFHNFSGNIQNKDHKFYQPNEKGEKDIVQDIVVGYDDAVTFHRVNRQSFIDEFAIDRVVPKILDSLPRRSTEKFPSDYSRYVCLVQNMMQSFIHELRSENPKRIDILEARIKLELGELKIAREEVVKLRQQVETLNTLNNRRIANRLRRVLRKGKAYVFPRNRE